MTLFAGQFVNAKFSGVFVFREIIREKVREKVPADFWDFLQ